MLTKAFWKDVAERVLATGAETLIGVITTAATLGLVMDWKAAAITTGTAMLVTVLKAMAASKVSNTTSPASFVKAEYVGEHRKEAQ